MNNTHYVPNPTGWIDPLGLQVVPKNGVPENNSDHIDLYRAVRPEELTDIQNTNLFQNPYGIENKYFTTSGEDASFYAYQSVKAFTNEPPYTIIKTTVDKRFIESLPKDLNPNGLTVDKGIPAFLVPTDQLPQMNPVILKFSPLFNLDRSK